MTIALIVAIPIAAAVAFALGVLLTRRKNEGDDLADIQRP